MSKSNVSTKLPIKSWPDADKPREKLKRNGASELTDAELLAIVIGTGSRQFTALEIAQLLLKEASYSLGELHRIPLRGLQEIKGIGPAKAIAIMAALELGSRNANRPVDPVTSIHSSLQAFELFRPHLLGKQVEEFWVAYLNQRHAVLSIQELSRGGITGTVVDIRLLFRQALNHMATCVIVAHNHPSGSLVPSMADKKLTEQMVGSGKLLQISVLDHLIIGNGHYFSFADEGLI